MGDMGLVGEAGKVGLRGETGGPGPKGIPGDTGFPGRAGIPGEDVSLLFIQTARSGYSMLSLSLANHLGNKGIGCGLERTSQGF